MALNPTTDTDFLEALLEAELDPYDVLPLIYVWVNGSRPDAIQKLNEVTSEL